MAIDAECIDNVVGMFDFYIVPFCSDMIMIFAQCHLSYILEDEMALLSWETRGGGNMCIHTEVFLGVLSKILAPAFTHLLFT